MSNSRDEGSVEASKLKGEILLYCNDLMQYFESAIDLGLDNFGKRLQIIASNINEKAQALFDQLSDHAKDAEKFASEMAIVVLGQSLDGAIRSAITHSSKKEK